MGKEVYGDVNGKNESVMKDRAAGEQNRGMTSERVTTLVTD